jgi:Cu2+-exporting ATPase
VELLSGDRTSSCERLAAKLAIPFASKQLPEQKYASLQKLRQEMARTGTALMYVGDGINDIPALAGADLSVATLETTDLVKSKADVVLLTTRLYALLELLQVGSRSNRIMLQNLAWAFAYNVMAIPLAAVSLLPPWAAALGMSVSSIIVLGNAGRILRIPPVTPPNVEKIAEAYT